MGMVEFNFYIFIVRDYVALKKCSASMYPAREICYNIVRKYQVVELHRHMHHNSIFI